MKAINKRLIQAALSVLMVSGSLKAQDLRFTQMFANPLSLNPAMMGINPDLKFILHYRNQWGAIQKGYSTYSFTTLFPVYMKEGKEKLDLGLNVLQDQAGAFKSLNASLAVGYNLQISTSGYLNFALMGGYVQKSLSTAGLTFDNQYVLGSYNSSSPTNETTLGQKVGYADVSFGTMWYYNPTKEEGAKLNAYLGASAFHLNQPNESFTAKAGGALPMRYSFQGGIKILGDGKIDFTPNIIYNAQKGSEMVAAGLLADYRLGEKTKISLGAWYRKKDAIAFSVGVTLKTFAFAYSYDIVTSTISKSITGLNANEISLIFKFNQSEKKGAKSNASF